MEETVTITRKNYDRLKTIEIGLEQKKSIHLGYETIYLSEDNKVIKRMKREISDLQETKDEYWRKLNAAEKSLEENKFNTIIRAVTIISLGSLSILAFCYILTK